MFAALRRFCGFLIGSGTLNGRAPQAASVPTTRSSICSVLALLRRAMRSSGCSEHLPQARRALNFLAQPERRINPEARQWRADELETAAAEAGLVLATVRTNEEFRKGANTSTCFPPAVDQCGKDRRQRANLSTKDAKNPLTASRLWDGPRDRGAGIGRTAMYARTS